jgi:hypothetical protein
MGGTPRGGEFVTSPGCSPGAPMANIADGTAVQARPDRRVRDKFTGQALAAVERLFGPGRMP